MPPKSLWDQLGDTFDATKKLSGQVSDIFGAYSTGKSVLQALGIMASDPSLTQVWDDLKQRLADIESKLDAYYKALEDEILGVGHIVLRQAVAEALAKSRTARIQTEGYIKNPTDPERITDFNNARSLALLALQELEPPNLGSPSPPWVQIYAPSTFYSDLWNGVFEPGSPQGNLVFDYRYALPAYQEVLLSYLFVYMAADSSYKEDVMHQLSDAAFKLANVYNHITSFRRTFQISEEDMRGLLPALQKAYFMCDIDSGKVGPPQIQYGPDGLPWDPSGKWKFVGEDKMTELMKDVIPGARWILANYPIGWIEPIAGATNLLGDPLNAGEGEKLLIVTEELWNQCRFFDSNSVIATQSVPVVQPAFHEFMRKFFWEWFLKTQYLGHFLYYEMLGLGELRDFILQLYAMCGRAPSTAELAQERLFLSLRQAGDASPGGGPGTPGYSLRALIVARGVSQFVSSLRQLYSL
jgi:hypothetical protein